MVKINSSQNIQPINTNNNDPKKKKTEGDENKTVTTEIKIEERFDFSLKPSKIIPNYNIFTQNQVSGYYPNNSKLGKAMEMVNEIANSPDNKSDIIEKMNQFNELLEDMPREDLLSLSREISALIENPFETNTDTLVGLQKAVLNEIKDKKINVDYQPLPIPPAPDLNIPSNNSDVSPEEIKWALELENKVSNQGYVPTKQESAKYEDIFNRLQGKMELQPPSQEEIDWAMQLEQKVIDGYQPNEQEKAAYADIVDRLSKYNQANSDSPVIPNTPPMGEVSQEELNWAMQLQEKFQQGQPPSQAEIEKYTDIYNRYTNSAQ